MLKVEHIDVFYGAIHAVKDLSIEVAQGEIVTLIGSNGAGKSTTLRTISGLMKPKSGTIVFEDKNIAGVPAHKIVASGLCQVPEGRHEDTAKALAEDFKKKTGADVSFIRLPTGEAVARLTAEKASPKADVWLGGTSDAHE